jgi:GNAT superfamily N-acetyltransferase
MMKATTSRDYPCLYIRANTLDTVAILSFFKKNANVHLEDQALWHHIERMLDGPSKICILAKQDDSFNHDVVIGFLSLDFITRPRGGSIAYLGDVLVDVDYRKRGIGVNLIKMAIEFAKSQQSHRLVLHCQKSLVELYSECGFSIWECGMQIDLSEQNPN